ncbi:MAG TPA: helix-turn-helix domain-containing protein [Cyclobacteriaceae bacterium]|jgi:TolB-like protein/AraC-like DNA-binding protein/Tfp pilus assembly protein PilF|nr:helix-turn-helix domain-containing protein [Cyclobacteriaceae bacterium]
MTESPISNEFLSQLTAQVEKNISNEQFGVSELADAMNMSRSNLLRKVKKELNLSVNQLIRDTRLKKGMDLLQKTSLNVSEVSHQVGFSSTSYFIKCFRELYGFPPGEVGKRSPEEIKPLLTSISNRNQKVLIISSVTLVLVIAIGLFLYYNLSNKSTPLEKSIAVLPFKNDSNDTTNVYLINGLMESTLTNLQRIEDLKVISRTSSEKYRSQRKSIPEMARELNVNYFVEGSGQKIGNQILLNVQLIEGPSDKHLWARQYKREAKDIFALQQEVAKNIVEEIQAIITPEERKKIEKIPTENLVAYDYFLKGREELFRSERPDLNKAIVFFNKAIEQDNKFGLAYAGAVISYYYLDYFRPEPQYTDKISDYADKAWLYDSKSDESLVAKALSYMHNKEYNEAIPYLEKALEYNPNSGLTIHFLSELYNGLVPNTAKYLQYALMGARINVAADSASQSFTYMHLGNALIQTGFVDEAMKYVDKSLAFDPNSQFAGWLKIGVLFAKTKDAEQTRLRLIKELNKDTISRFYLMQEIGKSYYFKGDYKAAYRYYKRFNAMQKLLKVDIFRGESLKMGIVWDKLGMKEEAKEYFRIYKEYAFSDKSIYKDLSLMAYYAWLGDQQKALDHMKLFSNENDYQYWILFMADEPLFDKIRNRPEFKEAMITIEKKFWDNHKKIRMMLEEKGLL